MSSTLVWAPMPEAMHGRVGAGDARPQDHDVGRLDPRGPPEQLALASAHALQEIRAHLRSEPARYLAHGRQQRSSAVGRLHRLVRQAGGPAANEPLGQFAVGRQMQVGEEHVPGLEAPYSSRSGSLTLTISSA